MTDRDELRSWFSSDVIVSGGLCEVGAGITFPFPPELIDMTLTGEVLEVNEPKVLAFSRGDEKLRLELSPEGEGTHLVLIDELRAALPPATWSGGRSAWTA